MPRGPYKHFQNQGGSLSTIFATSTVLDFTWVFDRPHHADLMAGGLLFDLRFYKARLDAFVVMAHHFHLVFGVPEGKTGPWLLGRLKSASGRRLVPRIEEDIRNRLGIQVGLNEHTFWRKSYRSVVVRSPQMFGQKVRYTHLNPVRAGICDDASNFRWSSARFAAQGLWSHQFGIEITDELISEFWNPEDLYLKSA